MGKKNNGNGRSNKTTQEKQQTKELETNKSNSTQQPNDTCISVSDVISEAHNIIYQTDDSLFGNLFSNSSSQQNNLKRKLNTEDSDSETICTKNTENKQKRPKHVPKSPNSGMQTIETNTEQILNKTTEAEIHVDSTVSPEMLMVTKMISNLSVDMRSMFGEMNNRINDLEANLERKITQKINQVIDKRISTEVSKVKKDVNLAVDTLRQDFDQDLKSVEDKLNDISKSVKHTGERDISYNLVIRNLPESANENLNSKISALMREGLKIQTISFSNVERKRSRNEHKSGVVIITCKSKDDLNQIMSSKCNLKFSRQYSDVYIHKDQSVQQRIERKNFQTIVDVLKSFDSEIDMRGAEIIAKRYVNHQQSRREGHFNRDMQSSRNEQSNSRHHRAGNRSQRDMHNNTHTGRRNDYNSDTRREQRDRNGEQQRHTTQGRW
ncbi:unnamed protein product [Mytilus edulis]|uniref:Uncharacterized protein n=2 Tax=Mytilus TaxID=6548 RepID=A0A8S3RH54_MYTED|nr:unnamed protein product [Mytilus edulis]